MAHTYASFEGTFNVRVRLTDWFLLKEQPPVRSGVYEIAYPDGQGGSAYWDATKGVLYHSYDEETKTGIVPFSRDELLLLRWRGLASKNEKLHAFLAYAKGNYAAFTAAAPSLF